MATRIVSPSPARQYAGPDAPALSGEAEVATTMLPIVFPPAMRLPWLGWKGKRTTVLMPIGWGEC